MAAGLGEKVTAVMKRRHYRGIAGKGQAPPVCLLRKAFKVGIGFFRLDEIGQRLGTLPAGFLPGAAGDHALAGPMGEDTIRSAIRSIEEKLCLLPAGTLSELAILR